MTRLAQAIRAASDDALKTVSLEALASDMGGEQVSMEQHVDDLDSMITLAQGLEGVVVSIESIDGASYAQQCTARDTAVTFLSMSGLSAGEAQDIFPSLESEENAPTAWEKFKAFLKKLWEFISAAAKKIYEFVWTILKKSSLAEKAAMSQVRLLRIEAKKMKGGLTREASIKLRPAHRYILDKDNNVNGFAGLKANVGEFVRVRDAVQSKLPETIKKSIDGLIKVVDKLTLHAGDEQASASIISHQDELFDTIEPLTPSSLSKTLGFSGPEQHLAHDRAIRLEARDGLNMKDGWDARIDDLISSLAIRVVQLENQDFKPEEIGQFPALSIPEIDQLLNLAATVIDEGHSADQQRKWDSIRRQLSALSTAVDGVFTTILKMKDLSPSARSTIQTVFKMRSALDKWASAPFMEINTINVRVVHSILALVKDQIENYELGDSMQERTDKAVEDRKKEEAKKAKGPKK